jgi:predicted metal-dependent hydrolase
MQLELPFEAPPARRDDPRGEAALRRIVLSKIPVWYRFVRARRRTLSIVIRRTGVEVRAPRRTPIAEVEDFLRQKAHWVLGRLDEAGRERRVFTWREGERLPLLGVPTPIVLSASHAQVRCVNERLEVGPALGMDACRLRAAVIAWMRAEARRIFQARLELYALRLGVPQPELRLSNARTQWGSYSARGRVLLNWRLLHMPMALIDYVVAHEMAHARELNHSLRFWTLLEGVYPECRAARREIKRLEQGLPEL